MMGCGSMNSTNASDKNSKKSEDLQTTLDIQQNGQALTFLITLENLTGESVSLTFMSGKHYEISIRNQENQTIYNSSEGKMFTQAINEVKLKPGKEKKWTDVFQGNLAKGKYTVEAKITTSEINPVPDTAEALSVKKTLEIK